MQIKTKIYEIGNTGSIEISGIREQKDQTLEETTFEIMVTKEVNNEETKIRLVFNAKDLLGFLNKTKGVIHIL